MTVSNALELAVPYVALILQALELTKSKPVWFPTLIPEELLLPYDENDKYCELKLWPQRGPNAKNNGMLDPSSFAQIVKDRGWEAYEHELDPSNLAAFCDKVNMGDMVVFGHLSDSADVIVKRKPKSVIEFQMKSGKGKVSDTDVLTELKKSVVHQCPNSGYSSLFVFVSASSFNFDINNPQKLKILRDAAGPNMTLHFVSVDALKLLFGESLMEKLQGAKVL